MTMESFSYLIEKISTKKHRQFYEHGLRERAGDSIQQFNWAREAAIYGLPEAMEWVINAYKQGFGTEPNAIMAFEWLKKAADQKYVWAYFELAIAYRDGSGTLPNIKDFRDWMEKAASAPDGREAMRVLSESYQKPKYGKPDAGKASHWTRLMAEAQGAVAMIDLSRDYATGRHTSRDIKLQLKWAERAESAARAELADTKKRDGASEDLPRALKALSDAYKTNQRPLKDANNILREAASAALQVFSDAEAAASDTTSNQILEEESNVPEDLLFIILQYKNTLRKGSKPRFNWLKKIVHIIDVEYSNSARSFPEFANVVFELAEAFRDGIGAKVDKVQYLDTLKLAKKVRHPNAMYELANKSSPTYAAQLQDAADAGSDEAFYRLQIRECDFSSKKANAIQDALVEFRRQVYEYREINHSVSEEDAKDGIAHYTGNAALEGMLDPSTEESKNLMRMYNFAYFNDPKEGRRLYLDLDSNNPLKEFGPATFYKDDILTEEHFVYIGSFSLAPDQLDLWRAYTDNGKGFAIVTPFSVFPKNSDHSLMETWANKRKLSVMPTLYKVLYSDQDAKNVLESLSPQLEIIKKTLSNVPTEKKEKIFKLVRTIANELLFLYKSEDYKTEREVRFVKAQKLNSPEVKRDSSRFPTRLYMETQTLFFSTPSSKIIIGPTVENKTSVAMALRHALTTRGWEGACEVAYSNVNYQIAPSVGR
ncbi:DUF2971 domain-containing protein [Duganella levis]|uniref:DUF2971 domain-containing protein n=1 Tax=Duganella levis TaxID=2692169 RepID=A0ABW9W4S3_9BURK|nr:DUF2971 domain-containing protein [Duganella levis]MYN28921.1 DUF2971 domain-containing protein [Duganella levis]